MRRYEFSGRGAPFLRQQIVVSMNGGSYASGSQASEDVSVSWPHGIPVSRRIFMRANFVQRGEPEALKDLDELLSIVADPEERQGEGFDFA